ncbi:MAG: metalloregulator ArsR/SmtB family transcription factor [Terriglobia bacterium]
MQGIAEQQARPVGFRRGQDVERAAESRKHNRHGKLAYPGGHSCARIDLTMDSACEILNQMVKYSETRLNATFAALADTTRRRILARLALGDTSVSDLAAPFDISLPGVTKHLRVLERAKLITRRKEGRVHRCSLVAEPMKGAAEWIEHYRQFWEKQFDALARFLEESPTKEDEPWLLQNKIPKCRSKSGAPSRRPGRGSTRHGSSAQC